MATSGNVMKDFARSWLPVFVALTVGFLTANIGQDPSSVQAEVRKSQKRTAFQSGGERSETLLREISSTLKQIDGRLQRIERAAAVAAKNRQNQPAK